MMVVSRLWRRFPENQFWMPDVEVVTLAGGIRADAEAFAREHGIGHVSTDLEECLDQPGVEAAVITSPNQVHCEQTVMALDKGKHVLLEKPMALQLSHCDELNDLAQAQGGLVVVSASSSSSSGGHSSRVTRSASGSRGVRVSSSSWSNSSGSGSSSRVWRW